MDIFSDLGTIHSMPLDKVAGAQACLSNNVYGTTNGQIHIRVVQTIIVLERKQAKQIYTYVRARNDSPLCGSRGT